MSDRCEECDRHFGIHADDCSQHSVAIPLIKEIEVLQARIAVLESAINHLINKSNVVTAKHRHKLPLTETALDNLYEAQVKAEMVINE